MRARIVVLSVLFGLLFAGATATTASAASGVTINRISVAPLGPGAKATIKPNLTVRGSLVE